MARYGDCDVAIDGVEAVAAIELALDNSRPYDLVCLDIMMPNMDGQAALHEIRKLETKHGIQIGDGSKIIMTTALSDPKNILRAFDEQCEGYIVKPVTSEKIIKLLKDLNLLESHAA